MKHFLIYANEYKDKNLVTAKRIRDFLQLKGQRAAISVMGGGRKGTGRRGHGGYSGGRGLHDCAGR